jgi:hypothetical protein
MANQNLGQGDTKVLDQIVSSLNPGVAPPDYKVANHWIANRRSGANILTAPSILEGIPAPVQLFALNVGGLAIAGTNWIADSASYWNQAGTTGTYTFTPDVSKVTNPAPIEVYQTIRYVGPASNLTVTLSGYDVTKQYRVRAHFCEVGDSTQIQVGDRVMTVYINGGTWTSGLDLTAVVGRQTAYILENLFAPMSNGVFTVGTTCPSGTQASLINGIEIFDR